MVNFEDLQVERNLEKKSFTFNDMEIQVLQYLPVSEKQDIIVSTLMQSKNDDELFNSPLLLDAFFHLNIVLCYTDIVFSPEDMEDKLDLYDRLRTSGLLELILSNMNPKEYSELYQFLIETIEKVEKYSNTAVGLLKSAMINLPDNAKKAVDIFKNLDPAQFKQLADIAETLNVNIPGLDKMKQ